MVNYNQIKMMVKVVAAAIQNNLKNPVFRKQTLVKCYNKWLNKLNKIKKIQNLGVNGFLKDFTKRNARNKMRNIRKR